MNFSVVYCSFLTDFCPTRFLSGGCKSKLWDAFDVE